MKRMLQITALLLVLATLFLVSCSSNGEDPKGNDEQDPIIGTVVSDSDRHHVEGTLHRISVKKNSRPFVSAFRSEYKVTVAKDNLFALEAAKFIISQIANLTGVELPFEENPVWTDNAKYISVGNEELFTAAGLTMPADDLGLSGYYIKTVNDSAFIATNGNEGYQLAAIAFLRHVIGYDMLSGDHVIYEGTADTLPDMEIVEKPDFDYRQMAQPVGKTAQYGMGYTNNGIFMNINGSVWHNSFQYLPPEKYLSSHPDWYYDAEGVTSATKGMNQGQLCYTAHGNEAELELMMRTAYAILKETVYKTPTLDNITFTQEDNYTMCDCSACAAEKAKYNGSTTVPVIKFLNQLATWLEEDLAKDGIQRRVVLSFFAYRATKQSPTNLVNGEYVGIDGIHCHKNVGVVIAPIEASFTHSFYEQENSLFAEIIKSWSAVSDNILMWLYETNFAHYLYPLSSWDTVAESYRFCKENNAIYMYNEGQWNTNNVSHFSKLKEYLDARLMLNVNEDYDALVNKFFRYYYGPAGETMREFFDAVQAQLRYLENTYPSSVKGGYKDSIAKAEYWQKKTLDTYIALIDRAYAEISAYQTTDPEQYEIYARHIKLESMFPRFALCTLYEGNYSSEEVYQMRSEFMKDCVELGITRMNEEIVFDELFKAWGV